MVSEQEVTALCAALKNWRQWAGDDMLHQLGVPKLDAAQKTKDYTQNFRRRLQIADRTSVDQLLEFFELGRFEQVTHVWSKPGFKLFISHVSTAKDKLASLSENLEEYGIISFLAHEDIKPLDSWRDVLMKALRSMDSLISFHTEGFDQSSWCGQEVGIAMGLGIPVIPIMSGGVPTGFISALQAVKWNPENPNETINVIIRGIHANDAKAAVLAECLARKLKFSDSYDCSDRLVSSIRGCGSLSEQAKRSIDLALKFNDQVRGRSNAMELVSETV